MMTNICLNKHFPVCKAAHPPPHIVPFSPHNHLRGLQSNFPEVNTLGSWIFSPLFPSDCTPATPVTSQRPRLCVAVPSAQREAFPSVFHHGSPAHSRDPSEVEKAFAPWVARRHRRPGQPGVGVPAACTPGGSRPQAQVLLHSWIGCHRQQHTG